MSIVDTEQHSSAESTEGVVSTDKSHEQQKSQFELELIIPFTTFKDGNPQPIPYVVEGLFTYGGLSAFGSKAKQGKSSFSRYEAVCMAKGLPILGRKTEKGEVLMVSLEDPLNHIDNCLHVLGYDPNTDALIQTVQKLPPTIEDICEVLASLFAKRKDIRFVTMDTLAKVLRVRDLNDYMSTMTAAENLHKLAREFDKQLHIQVLAHNKKVETTDPFDSILGSTALRGEPDTNIVIFNEGGNRIIQTETRIGKNIPASLLKATVVESAGADVVKDFSLDMALQEWSNQLRDKKEFVKSITYKQQIVNSLMSRDTRSAPQELILEEIKGNRAKKIEAIHELIRTGVISADGKPQVLYLDENKLAAFEFTNRFGGNGRIQ